MIKHSRMLIELGFLLNGVVEQVYIGRDCWVWNN